MIRFKNLFYKGYLKEKNEIRKDEKIKNKYKEKNENIIVIRQKWWVTIFYILSSIFKFLSYLGIMFLISSGVTILVNTELRNLFFSNLIKNFL